MEMEWYWGLVIWLSNYTDMDHCDHANFICIIQLSVPPLSCNSANTTTEYSHSQGNENQSHIDQTQSTIKVLVMSLAKDWPKGEAGITILKQIITTMWRKSHFAMGNLP